MTICIFGASITWGAFDDEKGFSNPKRGEWWVNEDRRHFRFIRNGF